MNRVLFNSKACLAGVLSMALVCPSAPVIAAGQTSRPDRVPLTQLIVAQGFGHSLLEQLSDKASSDVRRVLETQCSAMPPGQQAVAVAPFAAAVLGILVDWIVSSAIERISKNVAETIRQHSASYGNVPVYTNVMDPALWNVGESALAESCVVMQRVECEIPREQAKQPDTGCVGNASATGLRIGMTVVGELRDQLHFLQLRPLAVEVLELKPRHTGKQPATVAVSLQIDAVGVSNDAGYRWSSGEMILLTEEFQAKHSKGDTRATASLFKEYANAIPWSRSLSIPRLPALRPRTESQPAGLPGTHAALGFKVAEVGDPSSGIKGFAAFLKSNADALSGAFSAAIKKKIDIAE